MADRNLGTNWKRAMKKKRLPLKLGKEPIFESVFEIRMVQDQRFFEILPNHLNDKFDQKPIKQFPFLQIPEEIRNSDPNLFFAPLIEIELEKFLIRIGGRHVSILCILPYPKWPLFKDMVYDVMQEMKFLGIDGNVQRFSFKFVNIIKSDSLADQIGKIDFEMNVGEFNGILKSANLNFHFFEDNVLHILTIGTNASGTRKSVTAANSITTHKVNGLMLNVDSIMECNGCSFRDFVLNLQSSVEILKQSNKEMFFGCLTNQAIEQMEPSYE